MFRWTLALALVLAASGARAAPTVSPPANRSASDTVGSSSAPQALSDDDLGEVRAGEAGQTFMVTDQTLRAVTTGNTVGGDLNSGAVSFGAGAFTGFNGIGNFVVNTGANNTLQGSLSVTVMAAPTLP